MKTILFIAHSPDFYGADKVLFQVIDSARGSYRIHVVLPGRGEMAQRLAAFADVELHFMALPRFSLAPADVIANLVGFLPFQIKFRKFLARIGPDLVYGTPDDRVGSRGVPLAQPSGASLFHPTHGLDEQVTPRRSFSMIDSAYFAAINWDGAAGPGSL